MSVSTEFVRANLRHFGIPDIPVLARAASVEVPAFCTPRERIIYADTPERHIRCRLLSEICGDYNLVAPSKHADIFADGTDPQEDEPIGFVNSNRQFNFSAAPDLRTCLGWAIATDGGHERNLSHVNLDVEVERLKAALAAVPVVFLRPQLAASPKAAEREVKDFFTGDTWNEALKAVMRHDDTTQFGDGYFGVRGVLWRVGTRTLLGKEHPGFVSIG